LRPKDFIDVKQALGEKPKKGYEKYFRKNVIACRAAS
jgi:hypothetical protein